MLCYVCIIIECNKIIYSVRNKNVRSVRSDVSFVKNWKYFFFIYV